MAALAQLARRVGIPLVATNDVLYHEPRRRPLQDVLACIRAGASTVDEVGRRCEAGTGCGSCRGGIEAIIDRERRRRVLRGERMPAAVLAQLSLLAGHDDER